MAVGVDGSVCRAESVTHHNVVIDAKNTLTLTIGETGALYGAQLNGREVHIRAKNLSIESAVDTASSSAMGGGFIATVDVDL